MRCVCSQCQQLLQPDCCSKRQRKENCVWGCRVTFKMPAWEEKNNKKKKKLFLRSGRDAPSDREEEGKVWRRDLPRLDSNTRLNHLHLRESAWLTNHDWEVKKGQQLTNRQKHRRCWQNKSTLPLTVKCQLNTTEGPLLVTLNSTQCTCVAPNQCSPIHPISTDTQWRHSACYCNLASSKCTSHEED